MASGNQPCRPHRRQQQKADDEPGDETGERELAVRTVPPPAKGTSTTGPSIRTRMSFTRVPICVLINPTGRWRREPAARRRRSDPARTPYWISDIPKIGTKSGSTSTTTTPSTAVNAMEEAISSRLRADDRRNGRDGGIAADGVAAGDQHGHSLRQAEPAAQAVTRPDGDGDHDNNSGQQAGPACITAWKLIDAPRSITAISSSIFAEKPMPSANRLPGVQRVRTQVPRRIAMTRASR